MTVPTYAKKANAIFNRILEEGVDVRGKVVRADVYHDKWCPIYLGGSGRTCLCNATVELTVGETVYRDE